MAGVSLDSIEAHLRWAERLRIPYPLLSDVERRVGEAFGILRRIGIGGWNVEFLRRCTILANREGRISAVWPKVKTRGHAAEVLKVAQVLAADSPATSADGGEGA